MIENQQDIDKIYLHAKDPYESKYQHLINKREGLGINYFHDTKAFIEYSNDMHDVYKIIDEYNAYKENKIFIVFDDTTLASNNPLRFRKNLFNIYKKNHDN